MQIMEIQMRGIDSLTCKDPEEPFKVDVDFPQIVVLHVHIDRLNTATALSERKIQLGGISST